MSEEEKEEEEESVAQSDICVEIYIEKSLVCQFADWRKYGKSSSNVFSVDFLFH